jgi:hypothetical protein
MNIKANFSETPENIEQTLLYGESISYKKSAGFVSVNPA